MEYRDDSYAAMLLTITLSPGKDEYARPLSTQEFRKLEETTGSVGKLIGADISGLMMKYDMPEAEAVRIYTLINRGVQLSYAIEDFVSRDIHIVTCYNAGYPERLKRRMGRNAPPVLFMSGNMKLLTKRAIAIVGISGVKTTHEMRRTLEHITSEAQEHDFAVITGGERGVANAANNMVLENGGAIINVMGGDMEAHMNAENISALIDENRALIISQEHPREPFTVPHAAARNRSIFALSEAAFVLSTDGKRAEADSMRSKYCDWVYVNPKNAATSPLLTKGAYPMPDFASVSFDELAAKWLSTQTEQLSIFDLLPPDDADERKSKKWLTDWF